MYTKELDGTRNAWGILSPEGTTICYVIGEHAAEALLSHLNRG